MMKNRLLKLLLLFTLAGGASCTASGQFATVTGNLTDTITTASGTQPKIGATSTLAKTQVDAFPSGSGVLCGSIKENADISPPGTHYTVETRNNGIMTSSANYIIASNPWNLNTAVPVVTPPIPSGNIASARTFCFVQTSALTRWPIPHNFDAQNVLVQCADSNNKVLRPDTIVETDANDATVTFTSPQIATCMIMNAGNIVRTGQLVSGDPNIIDFNLLHNGRLISTVAADSAWTGNETVAGTETFNGAVAIKGPFTSQFSGPSPWIDVTSSTYGAVCDGVTNDTTAIQNALNAANSVSTTVYFPAGKTCAVTSLTLDGFRGVSVRGGWGAALPSDNQQATIRFTGTCLPSACLSIRSAGTINFYDIALNFPGAVVGPMVDLSRSSLNTDSQQIGFHGVAFHGPSTTVGPIILDQNTDSVTFDAWTQFYRASVFVEGPATNLSGSGFSDLSVFNQVIMENWGTSAVQNASIDWNFSNIIAESMNPGSCVPFLQYVNSFTNMQALSITNSLFSPGANNCRNAYTLISIPPASSNLGGFTFIGNLVIPNAVSTTGTMLSIGNGQAFTASGNVIQQFATVYSLGTGVIANIGSNIYSGVAGFLSGTPAGGHIVDNTGVTTVYGMRVGGGSIINSIFYAVGLPLNSAFTSVTAGTCQEQTLTLSGVTTKGVATANPEGSLGGNFSWQSWISAANTITVHLCAGKTATPNSVLWNASVID